MAVWGGNYRRASGEAIVWAICRICVFGALANKQPTVFTQAI